jgi:hypothetical protein
LPVSTIIGTDAHAILAGTRNVTATGNNLGSRSA